MADKHCEPGLYASLAAAATWNVAQEGDGTAMGAATPAIVQIDLSGASAAAGASISIMGATLSCVASGATTNQFNAGTGATLVSNLVTAINRSSNTATVAAQAAGWSTPKVQDAVFARIGSPTTTLEIMTRAGSAQYNSSVVAQSGFTSMPAAGPFTFSGGAGGAWGWWGNTTGTALASAVAACGYGLFCAQQPLAGVQAAGDAVYHRANNQTITWSSTNSCNVPSSVGTKLQPVTHYIDSGNKWSGDSPTATLTINTTANGSATFGISLANANAKIIGKAIGNKLWNWKITNSSSSGSTVFQFSLCNSSAVRGFNATAPGASTSALVRISVVNVTSGGGVAEFGDLTITSQSGLSFLSGGSSGNYVFDGSNVTIRNTGAASPHTAVLDLSANAMHGTIRDLVLEDFVVGSALTGSVAAASRITFINPDFGGVTSRGPYQSGSTFPLNGFVAGYSELGDRDNWIDGPRGFVEWNSGLSQPTLNALLPDGVTPWSFKILPLRSTSVEAAGSPLECPRIIKRNTLSTGPRTFTARFCISDTLAWTRAEVAIVVRYRDANGQLITLDSFDAGGGALTASTATWSQESGGQVTFSQGGTLYHDKFEMSVSTPSGFDLPNGADVEMVFRVIKSVSNTTQLLFLDPDIDIS